MNNFSGIGRLTKDIEIKTSGETKFASFNLAINRDKEVTDFIPCVAFNKQAETLSLYCEKGSQIAIEGKLQTRTYEDKNGQTRFAMEVAVHRVELLGKKIDKPIEATKKVEVKVLEEEDNPDDMPF